MTIFAVFLFVLDHSAPNKVDFHFLTQDNEEPGDFGFVLQFGEKIGEKVLLMKRLIETDFPALVSHVVVVVVVVVVVGVEETRGINYGEIVSFRKNIYVLTVKK